MRHLERDHADALSPVSPLLPPPDRSISPALTEPTAPVDASPTHVDPLAWARERSRTYSVMSYHRRTSFSSGTAPAADDFRARYTPSVGQSQAQSSAGDPVYEYAQASPVTSHPSTSVRTSHPALVCKTTCAPYAEPNVPPSPAGGASNAAIDTLTYCQSPMSVSSYAYPANTSNPSFPEPLIRGQLVSEFGRAVEGPPVPPTQGDGFGHDHGNTFSNEVYTPQMSNIRGADILQQHEASGLADVALQLASLKSGGYNRLAGYRPAPEEAALLQQQIHIEMLRRQQEQQQHEQQGQQAQPVHRNEPQQQFIYEPSHEMIYSTALPYPEPVDLGCVASTDALGRFVSVDYALCYGKEFEDYDQPMPGHIF